MQLDVRFFALYRERAGLSRLSLELPEGSTVADLSLEVRRLFPRLAPPEVKLVVAVNAEYADPGLPLREGDEVCLIPPVSGG
jgi:molybdopterin synthase catalytic subunit